VLVAGPRSALEKVRPVLERLGQHLFVIGEDAGLANLMKLAANALTATTLECMGEVMALLRKGGVNGHLAFDVLTNSLFDSRVHKTYGGKIAEGRYSPPGMAVPLATKDLRLALAEAEHAAVPMPAASLVHDRLVARRRAAGAISTGPPSVSEVRRETDSLGVVDVPADKLWGAQTQRSLEHFSIGHDLIPREMIIAYAILKKAAANTNHAGGRLDDRAHRLIVQTCDEILTGQHHDMFPLHVWMTGSGTQFNMNVNEVISNRCCQLAGTPLGSKAPVHPNDHVNVSQSSNDSFPSAMYIAAAVNVKERLLPAVAGLRDAIAAKAEEWKDIVKIGRTHMQDATPITLGQEWSGYTGMLSDDIERIKDALKGVYRLALGGTAVGTGINAAPGFAEAAAAEIARLTGLPFVSATNKFTVQGAHDALVQLSGTFRTLAVSLYKTANDIRLMSCGPRAGFSELQIPENEPGSSIMPGKVNPTQAEALTIAVQVMANDVAVGFGGAGGYLEMNVYKPLMIFNIAHSITILSDDCANFRRFLVEGTKPNLKKIKEYVDRSLMLVTALSPVIGYDKASKIAHYAMDNELTLKEAALKLGFVTEKLFDRVVDPVKMVRPYVAGNTNG
jgi:fumarate hydratase class II